VPLGGYVRFPENYNATLVGEQERANYLAEKADKKRRGTSTGQELVNALSFGLFEQQRVKREEAQRLFEAEEEKKLPFWSKFKLGAKKEKNVSTASITPKDVEIEYYDNPDLLQNRSWQQRAVVLSAGVIFNLLLSFSIYFGQIGFGPGLPHPIFQSGIVVNAAPRADGPANGILRKGDLIMSVNGSPITLSDSPTAFEAQKAISKFIATIRETPDGESFSLSVLHSGAAKAVDLSIKPQHVQLGKGAVGPQSIGVLLTPNFDKSDVLRSDSIPEAARLAYGYAVELTSQTANGLLSVAKEAVSGKGGGPAGQQVSGPIGLIKTGSEIVSTKDLNAVLLFAAAISINLGVVNSFPLPGLDGGQLVFVLAEAVMGRKVDQQFVEGITGVTVLLLLLSSVGAAFGDIQAIFLK
jgi:membrane-associated protease RseP (regulator of RpoE activity)